MKPTATATATTTATTTATSTSTFRYACEDCAYYVPDLEACAHGYPNEAHRKRAPLIVFCKEFELA